MDFSTVITELDQRNDSESFDYHTLVTRLQLVKSNSSASMTHDELCIAISCAFADFDPPTLTSNQLVRVAITIQTIWRLYPINVHGQTRLQVLNMYLSGDHEEVTRLALNHPSRPATRNPPLTPAPTTQGPVPSSPVFHPQPIIIKTTENAPTPPIPTQNVSTKISNVARYYTEDRKYGRHDHESLQKARLTFESTCNRFGVPFEFQKHCLDLAVKPSVHNLAQLITDNLNQLTEDQIWKLMEKKVYTTDRLNHIRSEWQNMTLKSFQQKPGETAVSTFKRLLQRLTLLQSQLPSIYNNDQAILDKLREKIVGQPWEQLVIPHQHTEPNQFIKSIKNAIHRATRSNPTSHATPSPLVHPSFITNEDPDYNRIIDDDDIEIDATQSIDEHDLNAVYFLLRKYSRKTSRPLQTMRYRRKSRKGPSAAHPCNICGAEDQWANHHFKDTQNQRKNRRQPSYLTDDPVNGIPTFTHLLQEIPPALSEFLAQATSDRNGSSYPDPPTSTTEQTFLTHQSPPTDPPPATNSPPEVVKQVFHTSATLCSTPYPIMNIGTYSDLMSTNWIKENKPYVTTDLQPSNTNFRFGNDLPPTVGSVGIALHLRDTENRPVVLHLPKENVVSKSTAPLLIGYETQAKYDLITRPSNHTILKPPTRNSDQLQVIQGKLVDGHLCLVTTSIEASCYSKQELRLIHRQFGHKETADVLKSFPPGTFSSQDIKFLTEIASTCRPCQEYV